MIFGHIFLSDRTILFVVDHILFEVDRSVDEEYQCFVVVRVISLCILFPFVAIEFEDRLSLFVFERVLILFENTKILWLDMMLEELKELAHVKKENKNIVELGVSHKSL